MYLPYTAPTQSCDPGEETEHELYTVVNGVDHSMAVAIQQGYSNCTGIFDSAGKLTQYECPATHDSIYQQIID